MTARLHQSFPRCWWIVEVLFAIGHEANRIIVRMRTGEFPLHVGLAFIVIKACAVAGYALGKQWDSWLDAEGNAVVRTDKGIFVVRKEQERARETRMGLLGLPEDQHHRIPEALYTSKCKETEPASECQIDGQKAASVAVVVPVLLVGKNQEAHRLQLQALLRCIHGQVYRPALIILVDDGSPTFPSLRSLRQGMHQSCTCNIRLLTVKNPVNLGPSASRNKGIDKAVSLLLPQSTATGLLIFLTDFDCLPTPTWIQEGHHWLQSGTAGRDKPLLLGGITVAAAPPSIFGRFHDAFGTLNPRLLGVKPLYCPSCNIAIYLPPPTQDVRMVATFTGAWKFPRFDESFREASMEDVLFCLESTARRGVEFQLVRRMVVEHVYTSTRWHEPESVAVCRWFLCFCSGLCATLTQFRRYGRWERACDVKYPAYAWHHLTKSLDVPSPQSQDSPMAPQSQDSPCVSL